MSDQRRSKPRLLASLLITLLVTLVTGCTLSQKKDQEAGVYEGPLTPLGQGSARSFVALDADGRPATIGIRLSEAALTGLPAEDPVNSHGWEYLLQLPPESANIGYDHIGVDWNPHGHIPPGVYDKPHFDFHFYLIDIDARNKITAVGDDLNRAHKAPSVEFMPSGYILPPGTEVPKMGAHAIDPNADEFAKKSFTKTFIYGFYDGAMIFLEPMITKAYLESKPDDLVQVAVPKQYPAHGYYPTQYVVKYDQAHGEYLISLTGLVRR
jgi:hypothetical protein